MRIWRIKRLRENDDSMYTLDQGVMLQNRSVVSQ